MLMVDKVPPITVTIRVSVDGRNQQEIVSIRVLGLLADMQNYGDPILHKSLCRSIATKIPSKGKR